MKKLIIILSLIIVVILVVTLPIADRTSGSERVIVDHTLKVIIHPECYDAEEGLTNYIDEVSYSNAVDNYDYSIRGECSKEKLPEGKTSILNKILEK